jgi:hypothetical protein
MSDIIINIIKPVAMYARGDLKALLYKRISTVQNIGFLKNLIWTRVTKE